jgi:hypothetical protein
MSIETPTLAHAYHQRRGAFLSEERLGDWRLKLYGLARPEIEVRPELAAITRDVAAEVLPPVDAAHHGAAFAIAHDARFPIALVYWWQDENELHSAIRAGETLDAMGPVAPSAHGCVWEMGIIEFERRAWIADVIGNPDGPDPDRYMSRRFEGLI